MEEPKEIPTVIAVVEKEGKTEVPNSPNYVNQEKLIQQYWLRKKMALIGKGLLPDQFDRLYKEQYISEAKVLYPKKGMYKVEGNKVEFLGKI